MLLTWKLFNSRNEKLSKRTGRQNRETLPESRFKKQVSKEQCQKGKLESGRAGPCMEPQRAGCPAGAALPALASRWGHGTGSHQRSRGITEVSSPPQSLSLGKSPQAQEIKTVEPEAEEVWVSDSPHRSAAQARMWIPSLLWAKSEPPYVEALKFSGRLLENLANPVEREKMIHVEQRPRGGLNYIQRTEKNNSYRH